MSIYNWLMNALYRLSFDKVHFKSEGARFLGTIDCAPSHWHHLSGNDVIVCDLSDYLIFSDVLYTEQPQEFNAIKCIIKPLKASKNYLGTRTRNIIFDARQSFPLDYIACLVGTMCYQGRLIILLDSDAKQDQDSMRFMGCIAPTPNFNAWLTQIFNDYAWCYKMEKWHPPSRFMQAEQVCQSNPFLLTPHTLSTSQTDILTQLLKITAQISVDSIPNICTLFGDRGTGKSYLVHRFLAELNIKQVPFFLTAPNQQALSSYGKQSYYAFDYLLNMLQSTQSNHDASGKPQPMNAWLLIEECAVLPLKIIIALSEYFKAVLLISSTNDYEGAGRGLAMKLNQHLALTHIFALTHSLRFDDQDCVQTWLNALLFKTSVDIVVDFETIPNKGRDKKWAVDFLAEQALAQWRQDVDAVRRFYQLLYQSHYQTNAQDIRRLWDDPHTILITTQDQLSLAGGIWGLKEGGMSAELAQAVYVGHRRPFGNLAVQTLCAHGYFEGWMQLRSVRVSRIFVAQQWRKQGIASNMLSTLVTHLVTTPTMISYDFISVSFGLTCELLDFWFKQGFIWIHLSSSKDKSSGLHSAVMIKPLSDKAKLLCLQANTQFLKDIPLLAKAPFIEKNAYGMLQAYGANTMWQDDFNVSTNVDTGSNNLDEKIDEKILSAFVHHHKPFEACFCAILRLAEVDSNIALHFNQVLEDNNIHERKKNIQKLKYALAIYGI